MAPLWTPKNSPESSSIGSPDNLAPVLIVVLVIQVLSALSLIFLVLLHSGRGGGLSDMFGGGLGASAQGSTVVEKNLDRLTVVAAVIFMFASVALSLLLDR
ncbi:SecG Preprotein translocase subunit SecG [Acidimicrobiia bacterium]